jgi:chemotaxis protein methyltransferase CheR
VGDAECVSFLQWALPRLHLRWAGFRKVRRQVCKRIGRRILELKLSGVDTYRAYLETHADEWAVLDALCRITISRFHRDRGVFERLEKEILPDLASRAKTVRCWSIGCASGEEPYTLAILWRLRVQPLHPRVQLRLLATDVDAHLLERARMACYGEGSLHEVPGDLRLRAFTRSHDAYCLREEYRQGVELQLADVRTTMPDERFHLVLCRNIVLTYFEESLQREVLARIEQRILPGGFFVVGRHESLPDGTHLSPWKPGSSIFVRSMGS